MVRTAKERRARLAGETGLDGRRSPQAQPPRMGQSQPTQHVHKKGCAHLPKSLLDTALCPSAVALFLRTKSVVEAIAVIKYCKRRLRGRG